MGRISAENILMDYAFYLMMAIPFGIAFGGADVQNLLSSIFAPWPTFQQTVSALSPKASSCSAWDWGCQASAGVAQATGFIGAAIGYPGVIAASALNRISAFGVVSTTLTFGPTTSLLTIPGAPIVILFILTVVVFELFRMFRGSSVGA